MFGRRVTLFRLFGFAVRVDASWIVIAVLVTWSLAAGVFPAEFPGLAASSYWWMGLIAALGFFGSIVFHELCHSLVANRYKLPMHGITLFIFGGVAEMGSEPATPKIEFLMALAGPVSSIVLGFMFWGLYVTGAATWPVQALGVLAYLAWINWLLAAFNLIPAFPLDGGRILRAALWHFKGDLRRATRIASAIGGGFGALLFAYGIFRLLAGNLIAAIWYCLIGAFLRGASRASYEQLLWRTALEGEPVSRFMRPDPVAVRAGMSLRQLVDDYVYRYGFKTYPVVADGGGNLVGCVATRDVSQIPREEWERHHVEEIVHPCAANNTVSSDTDALQALNKIRENEGNNLLVTDHDRLLATVSPGDIMNFLAAKLELEGGPRRPLLPAGQ